MKELTLPPELSCEIREIYDSMVTAYDEVARAVTLTCDGCPDNCCDSYFLHYTYREWASLRMGLRALGDEPLDRILGWPQGVVRRVQAHDSWLARRASDHLPLTAEVDLPARVVAAVAAA